MHVPVRIALKYFFLESFYNTLVQGVTVKLKHLILKGTSYKIKKQLLGKMKYKISSIEIIFAPSQEENASQDATRN